MTTILIILLAVAFVSGAPLFTIMFAATAVGAFLSTRGYGVNFPGAINKMFGTSNRDEMTVLSTIPMFIYAGYLLAESKTADRLVRFANALLGWLPGGLAIVTIMTCALFTVFTGASGVTIIALGGVLMPALVKNGYPKKFAMGLIAGTGSVGLLFPPALPLFVYGTVYGLSDQSKEKIFDTKRFLVAGVVPGMFLVACLAAVAVFVAVKNKLPTQKFSGKELSKSFVAAIPELMIPFGVIILMISGTFDLPEIAALTVVYVLLIELFLFKTLTPKMCWKISFEAIAMIGAIFAIIFASTALTDLLVQEGVPAKMVAWTQANVHSKVAFLLAINVILLIVGTVMDIFSAIVIVLPLLAPIAVVFGIDPYHLGVIFLLNLEVGYLHPPVGLNLFLTSVKFNRPITEVMWATIPFLVTMIISLVVITYVPALTAMSLKIQPPARNEPVSNLTELVVQGFDDVKVSHPDIVLVDATGKPLLDSSGKQVTRHYKDCKDIKDDSQRLVCQQMFWDVTECQPKKDDADPAHAACASKAIATWIVNNLNDDAAVDSNGAFITVSELPLADVDGKPLEWDSPVLEKGEPKMTEDGDPVTEKKPLADAAGAPLVKKLASCDALKGSERDTCRAIFISASNCQILPTEGEDLKTCVADAVASWVSDNNEIAAKL